MTLTAGIDRFDKTNGADNSLKNYQNHGITQIVTDSSEYKSG